MIRSFICVACVLTLASTAPAARRSSKPAAKPATSASASTASTSTTTIAPTTNPLNPALATAEDNLPLAWFDGELLTLEGRAYNDTPTTFSRLPARAEGQVTSAVWHLSKYTAGLCLRFATDSKSGVHGAPCVT